MTIGTFITALLVCAICAVEWAAARTDTQHILFKTLTPITALLALVAGVAAIVSGWVEEVVWGAVGCSIVFVAYGLFRIVTRKT